MSGFDLDPRLARDTVPVAVLGLCALRLMNDSRWPWLILVPQRPGLSELHDMTALDRTMLGIETTMVAGPFKAMLAAAKLNIASIGNVVPMLHVHVIARNEGDANWPGPVWGFGAAVPYAPGEAEAMAGRVRREVLGQ